MVGTISKNERGVNPYSSSREAMTISGAWRPRMEEGFRRPDFTRRSRGQLQ
ncbi:MAG: hypothetical protein U5K69_16215 [Balneolaceae bacterium]|nr:hypothetical protein [Balneolaceae bacterium]